MKATLFPVSAPILIMDIFIKSPTQLFFHAILLIYHFLVYQFRPYQTYVKFKEIYACILFLSRISKLADWRIYFQVNAAERWKISLHWLWLNTKELKNWLFSMWEFFDIATLYILFTIFELKCHKIILHNKTILRTCVISTIFIFRIVFSRLKLSETDTIQITRDKDFGNPAVLHTQIQSNIIVILWYYASLVCGQKY